MELSLVGYCQSDSSIKYYLIKSKSRSSQMISLSESLSERRNTRAIIKSSSVPIFPKTLPKRDAGALLGSSTINGLSGASEMSSVSLTSASSKTEFSVGASEYASGSFSALESCSIKAFPL